MRERKEELDAAGVRLAFVGNGNVEQANRFHLNHAPDCDVFTDPSLGAYRTLGLRRSVVGTLGLASVVAGVRSTLRGHHQRSVQGDPWQLGGVFAMAQGGKTVYAQRFVHAGERPDATSALKALMALRRR